MTACLGVVHLVGDHRGEARVAGQGGELGDEPVVVRATVVGELDGEVAIREMGGPVTRGVQREITLPGEEVEGNFAIPTAAQTDEVAPCVIERSLDLRPLEYGELLLSGEVRVRDEPRKGGVAGRVAGQQHEVVARGGARVELTGPTAARLGTTDRVIQLAAAASGAQLAFVAWNRELDTNDRADRDEARLAGGRSVRLLRRLPEADRAVHAGVIGDRQSRHLEQSGAGD